ncbi:hypothetical protein [Rhodococcoides kyotonense]|uniref:Fe-S oxidoreductase n=1 Tax=Rhodococcoides kyotonense TaxID=398843 RepID=A0A239LUW3_9NOCA|nr:hypothetical protein [Rhodococcus kyotonensis]SNT34316.1 hypothetical protein SAMN05421642_114141 [Rhodococcus kyotonensis]
MGDRARRAARGSIGALFATYVALGYARLWRAKITFDDGHRLFVASGIRGGFGRGGTTIGGVYLTRANTSHAVLRHESVHADQWARYGLLFAVRYLFEEVRHPGPTNKYEIEAGLEDGGYKGRPRRY